MSKYKPGGKRKREEALVRVGAILAISDSVLRDTINTRMLEMGYKAFEKEYLMTPYNWEFIVTSRYTGSNIPPDKALQQKVLYCKALSTGEAQSLYDIATTTWGGGLTRTVAYKRLPPWEEHDWLPGKPTWLPV